MMLKQQAVFVRTLTVCVLGLSGLTIAAPSKTGATIIDPFALTSVTASTTVVTVSPSAVVISASPIASSGIAPGKGGGTTPVGPIAPPPGAGGPNPPVPPGPATP